MFRGLINDAKVAAASFLDRYLARASVAVPFVIAVGFATAAAALALTAHFGATNAFFIMAAGFCAIGVVAVIAAALKERKEQETAAGDESEAEPSGLGEMATAATQAAGQLPLGLVASALGSPSGASSLVALERILRRHLPLLLLLGLVAFLIIWPGEGETEARESDAGDGSIDEDAGGKQHSAQAASLREAA
ncbi:MAG: hypothetical protein J2P50_12745 [Hyphomicrobiaceae bacterium]|nr:hypothetical protein [Hyphomicrobiaceae bacterium]